MKVRAAGAGWGSDFSSQAARGQFPALQQVTSFLDAWVSLSTAGGEMAQKASPPSTKLKARILYYSSVFLQRPQFYFSCIQHSV